MKLIEAYRLSNAFSKILKEYIMEQCLYYYKDGKKHIEERTILSLVDHLMKQVDNIIRYGDVPLIYTSDKFGVPLRTDEAGTFTKEECIRRGFDPDICPWLLKPELREDKDNET